MPACGDGDTHNAKEFAFAVCAAASNALQVTVDLTRVDFSAIDGVAAPHAIDAQISRADTSDTSCRVRRCCECWGCSTPHG